MRLSSIRKSVWILLIAVIVVAGGWYFFSGSSSGVRIVSARVTEGPIVRSVTATGTVNPVITVQLGTYVSGPIIAIYKDYNAPVAKGQVLFRLDDRDLKAQLLVAQANLAAADANVCFACASRASTSRRSSAWEKGVVDGGVAPKPRRS